VEAETHYDVLGLEPRASREQVEKAYRFCMELYGDASLATYSLLEAGEREAARTRVLEAYDVLADPIRRREYDLSCGLATPGSALLSFPPASSRESEVAEGSTPLSVLSDAVTGADLRRVRESRGVSLREIAVKSKIGVRFLEYIEQDRYPFLPAPVYLRGFLQEYARMVGLDPRRTADAYMARMPERD
jgi:curved DNA-binding protein CbpA